MRYFLLSVAAVFSVISPIQAQVPYSGSSRPPPPYLSAGPDVSGWGAIAPTPDDAYRDGLINRYDLERAEGPLPPALQGPSVNGTKGQNPGQ